MQQGEVLHLNKSSHPNTALAPSENLVKKGFQKYFFQQIWCPGPIRWLEYTTSPPQVFPIVSQPVRVWELGGHFRFMQMTCNNEIIRPI